MMNATNARDDKRMVTVMIAQGVTQGHEEIAVAMVTSAEPVMKAKGEAGWGGVEVAR